MLEAETRHMNRRSFFKSVAAGAGALWLPDVARVYSFPTVERFDALYLETNMAKVTARFYEELLTRLAAALEVPRAMLVGPTKEMAWLHAHALATVHVTTVKAIHDLELKGTIRV